MSYYNKISGGNADTELGGSGQDYATPQPTIFNEVGDRAPNSPATGNVNSDMGQWNFAGTRYNDVGLNPRYANADQAYTNIIGWGNPNGAPQPGYIDRLIGGSGVGPQMQKMDYYQALGQQLRSALQGPQQAPAPQSAPLTAGFDQGWLSEALAAGSANGAKIGGMGSGGGGGGGGKSSSSGDAESNPGSWGQYSGIGDIQGAGMGTGE